MKMNKLLTIALAGVLGCGMVACAQNSAPTVQPEKTEDSGLGFIAANVSYEECIEKTGIDLPSPEGATDVCYNIIDPDTDAPMIDLDFTYNGKNMCLRAQKTDLLPANEQTSEEELTTTYNISGLRGNWDRSETCEVKYCTGYAFMDSVQNMGFVSWTDAVPGIQYSLCMCDHLDFDGIQQLAGQFFVPMQGDC